MSPLTDLNHFSKSTSLMDSKTIRKLLRTIKSKKSSLLCFFLVLFLFFIMFPLFRLQSTAPFFLTPNVIEIPEFPFSVSSKSIKNSDIRDDTKPDFLIENTVLLTDFFLVILATNGNVSSFYNVDAENKIECFYQYLQETERTSYPVSSIDEYDSGGSRRIVRCPLPPSTNPSSNEFQVYEVAGFDWVAKMTENQTVKSWNKMLAYEAAFDGEETVAVFVKGLRLNGQKKSDPSQFICRFGDDFELSTKAITAAQEVIRCPLPKGVTKSSVSKNNGVVPVTIERVIESKGQGRNQIVPSIAKLHKGNDNGYNHKNKYDLCACTMVWNQAGFIREWIMYHAWLGIERWFIYDNNSDDGLNEEIDSLNSENCNVTGHIWPWIKSQEAGFAHCLLRARDQCNWIAFFDVDEFYYIPIPKHKNNTVINNKGRNSLRAIVQNVTSTSPSKGQIRTDCYNFGPSGLKEKPTEGVALGYTCRLKVHDRHKSMVRAEAVDESLLNRVHHFELKTGFSARKLHQRTAIINHYKYQVWDVFKTKFERRVSAYVPDWKEQNSEKSKDRTPGLGTQAIEPKDWNQRFCQVWDTKLRNFIRTNLAHPNTTLLPWQ